MGSNAGDAAPRKLRIETVRGEPIEVQGRSLTPEARIVSFGRARATIGSRQIGGWATGFAHVTPLAMIEETGEGERRITTTDSTATALWALLGAAAALMLIFPTLRWLVRRARNGAS